MSDIPSPVDSASLKPVASVAIGGDRLSLECEPEPSQATAPVRPQLPTRIWCAFVFAITTGMLGIGLLLTPDPSGLETHRQLHLPPCGFYLTSGLPCPTCGCTTAVSYFAHGRFVASFLTQPFGFAAALLALLVWPLATAGLLTGRWLGPSMFTLSWYWRVWLYGGLGLLAAAWVYKIILVRSGHPLP
jgi:hypothetical protein